MTEPFSGLCAALTTLALAQSTRSSRMLAGRSTTPLLIRCARGGYGGAQDRVLTLKVAKRKCMFHSLGLGMTSPAHCCNLLQEALDAFQRLSQLEGIIPALETSHAIAYLEKLAPTLKDGTRVVINCSGRGDKDGET